MCRLLKTVVSIAVIALGAGVAHAQAFAIESNVGHRPPEMDRAWQELRAVLADKHKHIEANPAILMGYFDAHLTRPGLADPQFDPSHWTQVVEAGVVAYGNLDIEAAARDLGPAIEAAHANPAAIAREPKYRDELGRALLFYALTLNRQAGDLDNKAQHAGANERDQLKQRSTDAATKRDDTIQEYIRSFPNAVIQATDYGAEAAGLFRTQRQAAEVQGRASLVVDVVDAADPNAQEDVVYVDEDVQGHSHITLGDRIPGAVRVLIQSASRGPIVYPSLQLVAKQTTQLHADLDLDTTLVIAPGSVGFVFTTEESRDSKDAAFMTTLGKSINATLGFTFEIVQWQGRLALNGSEFDILRGGKLRSATVPITFDLARDRAKLEQLVDFLSTGPLDEPPGPALVDVIVDRKRLDAWKKAAEPPQPPPPAAPPPAPSTQVAVHAAPAPRADPGRRHLWPTYVGIGVGAALIATGGVLVHISPEGTCGMPASECPYIYGTAPLGWTSIGVGAGALAFSAVWFFMEHKRHPSMESVGAIVPVPGGAMASFGGSF